MRVFAAKVPKLSFPRPAPAIAARESLMTLAEEAGCDVKIVADEERIELIKRPSRSP
jgi:hypothetical protein